MGEIFGSVKMNSLRIYQCDKKIISRINFKYSKMLDLQKEFALPSHQSELHFSQFIIAFLKKSWHKRWQLQLKICLGLCEARPNGVVLERWLILQCMHVTNKYIIIEKKTMLM